MASEDVNRSESAMNKIVKFAEEAKLAREDIKPTSYAALSVCKSLFAGGVAGGLLFKRLMFQVPNSCGTFGTAENIAAG
ncbi:hypothetical protein LIER_21780 [Lithospermum erythrorhizon]|uniref:Uncharacterized protein n=1 Tax=Lithospermum erythrorhizon TaxID=34254 RepID=A0AAV3QTS7_LITER